MNLLSTYRYYYYNVCLLKIETHLEILGSQ